VSARNPGVLVHRLLWSASHGRPVRITHRDRGGTTTGIVERWGTDPVREKAHAAKPSKQASTVVVVLRGGAEVAVDSVQKVQLPHGDSGAAFMDGE
jgi:hypothetical protein